MSSLYGVAKRVNYYSMKSLRTLNKKVRVKSMTVVGWGDQLVFINESG